MADSIVDIVHRISYEINGQERIQTVQRQFQSNVETIARNTASLARLQAQLNQTTDPRRQNQLTQAIANRTRVINEQGQAIQRTIQTDRTFQQSLQREIGIINELNGRLNSLRTARNSATSTADIRNYDRQIRAAEREMRRASGGGILGGIQGSILQGIGIGSGIQIFDTIIGKVGQFIQEAGRLAAELEGVKPAFDRLNNPNLLDGLRDATKGTVSDLELMKQAVQFSNFGLPVDRLAEALKFARIRARETGQSVDYLVQSIVLGVGRQSVQILDNLGINAKRVREEFEKTGDFVGATFSIAAEEIQKSGADLDTFAEKMAKLDAQIANTQAEFGGAFNFIKGGFVALGQDVLAFGQALVTLDDNVDFGNTQRYLTQLELRAQAEEEAAQKINTVNARFTNDYKKFTENINVLDLNARSVRLQEAEAFYNKSLADAKSYYGADIAGFNAYVSTQTAAFNRLKSLITQAPVNLATVTAANISSATKNQLEALKTSLQQQQGDIGNDPIAIANNLRQQQAVDNVLKRYQPPDISGAIRRNIRSPRITPTDFNKLRDQILAGYRKIQADIAKEMVDPADYFTDSKFAPDLIGNAYKELADRETPEDRSRVAQLEIAQDVAEFERKQKDAQLEADKQRDEERVESSYAAYNAIAQNAALAINSILDAQIRAFDREIQYRNGTIAKAQELAQRGNAEVLKEEEEQLRKATAAKEAAVNRQIQLNALLQAANMAVALSEAIGAIVSAAAKGDPYTIAARVIAAVAALVGGVAALSGAFSSANQGFAEGGYVDGKGGYTGNGGKYQAAGTVHKGEFVFTKEKTSQYRDVFEQIHKGAVPLIPEMVNKVMHPMYLPLIPNQTNEGNVSRKELKAIASKLDGVIDAVDNIKLSANQTINENGISQIVERTRRRDAQRFS